MPTGMPIASATSTETKISDSVGKLSSQKPRIADHAEADPREDRLAPARHVARYRDDQREQPDPREPCEALRELIHGWC